MNPGAAEHTRGRGRKVIDVKIHGTTAWFEMVGTLLADAASQARLATDFNFCFVERYSDGIELASGLVQGIRFEIIGGKPSFRVGATKEERGNITVEITAAGSRALNTLYGIDPHYKSTIARLKRHGELKVDGDFLQLGFWFHGVHDQIVESTR